MRSIIIFAFLINLYYLGYGQVDTVPLSNNNNPTSKELDSKAWLEDLYESAVKFEGDTIVFNNEAKRILEDSVYHQFLYPKVYTWQVAQQLMERKALKQTFWYLINLYYADKKNRDLVLKMILPYDQVLKMDKVIISVYYSYIAFDPEVATIKNGKTSEVIRPDIAEQKLSVAKEIIKQILNYRTQRPQKE
jgi:hypothetical protein